MEKASYDQNPSGQHLTTSIVNSHCDNKQSIFCETIALLAKHSKQLNNVAKVLLAAYLFILIKKLFRPSAVVKVHNLKSKQVRIGMLIENWKTGSISLN